MSVHEAMKNACDITHLKNQISVLHSLVEEKDLEIDNLNLRINRQVDTREQLSEIIKEQEVEIESLKRMLAEHGYRAVEVDYFVARCKAVEETIGKLRESQDFFLDMIQKQFAQRGVEWKTN